MDEDVIVGLKTRPFSQRNISEKKEIMPALETKIGNRAFQVRWYDQHDWLCASSSLERLYCWPCLLFQPRQNQSWTDGGYNNFKNILSDGKAHSITVRHLSNYKAMKSFGLHDIATSLSESAMHEKNHHNKLVEENRQYLKCCFVSLQTRVATAWA